MTVQELASKMNELMRSGLAKDLVYFSFGKSNTHYPINGYKIGPIGTAINTAVILRCDSEDTIFKGTDIPIEKSDLERAQRATYDPKE